MFRLHVPFSSASSFLLYIYFTISLKSLGGSKCWNYQESNPVILRRFMFSHRSRSTGQGIQAARLIHTVTDFYENTFSFKRIARDVHPPKSMMHIAYSPYFHKIYEFPPLCLFCLTYVFCWPLILTMMHLSITPLWIANSSNYAGEACTQRMT